MKIGAMNHPAQNPLYEIEWIAKNAFDFVDFTFEPPAADASQVDTRAVRVALERNGLSVVAHTAWYLPYATPFGGVREACLGEFLRVLPAAREIGATVLNVHYAKPPNFFLGEQVIG